MLAAAFEEAERQPALSDSRDRALELVSRGSPPHEVAAVVESDVGLTCAVIRAAGQLPGGGRVRSVPDAVERLGPGAVDAILRAAPTYDLFGEDPQLALSPDRFRLHALTVQRAADRISDAIGFDDRDELALAAILHDIGRPVLARLHPGYAERFDRQSGTPDDRVARERGELGMDHALVGGVLTRRWGLHQRIAIAVEKHHSKQAEGAAPVIRLADMIVAYLDDSPVDMDAMLAAGQAVDLHEEDVRKLLYEIPQGMGPKRRASTPCPLSPRELDVLRRLAEGKVYKQIASELELSASTVRSHLHNVYGKLGALDRAQAVLMATEQGWI